MLCVLLALSLARFEALIPPAQRGGRPRKTDMWPGVTIARWVSPLRQQPRLTAVIVDAN
jgi:hypothetical protein